MHVASPNPAVERKLDRLGARLLRIQGQLDQVEAAVAHLSGQLNRSVGSRFDELRDQWKAETAFASSLQDRVLHPAYQQIIGLGPHALPYLLKELRETPDHWFWALGAITGADPVPDEAAGDFDRHVMAWLAWADEVGIPAPVGD